MDNAITYIILALAAALAVAALIISLVRGQESRAAQKKLAQLMRHSEEKQADQIDSIAVSLASAMAQVQEMNRSLDRRMESLREQNDRKLDGINSTVNEKLDARLQGSFRLVNSQLGELSKELGELRQLSGGITDIRRMLTSTNSRGAWGEARLRALIENQLSPAQYVENAQMDPTTTQRVEFAIRLPAKDGEALLPVDSKFPQADYLRLIKETEEGTPSSRAQAQQMLERTIRESAKEIHDKYIRPPRTTEYAILFLPTESLYAEAARCPGLMEDIQKKYSVMLSGPATFSALLLSLEMGFRTQSIERRSGDVLRALASVKAEFGRLEECMARLSQRLDQADEAFSQAEGRVKKLRKSLNQIENPETDEN